MSVTSRPHSKPPPPGLHTVELLRAASQRLHIGPKQAMDIAEKLYVEVSITLSQNQLLSFFVVVLFSVFFLLWLTYFQGYISYPRTETTQYSPDFELKPILHEISHNPEYQQFAIPLMQEKINVPKYVCACVLFVPTSLCSMSAHPCHHVLSTLLFSQVLLLVLLCFSSLPSFPVFFHFFVFLRSGRDAGDHPPITPMKSAQKSHLSDTHWKVYDLVVTQFLASVS